MRQVQFPAGHGGGQQQRKGDPAGVGAKHQGHPAGHLDPPESHRDGVGHLERERLEQGGRLPHTTPGYRKQLDEAVGHEHRADGQTK